MLRPPLDYKFRSGPRYYGGLVNCCAILFAILAAHFLISCGTSDGPTTTPAAAEIPEVAAKEETGSETGAPATDTAVVLVGVVESVDGNKFAVATLHGTFSVILSDESTIQEFAAGSLENLLIGQRVTITGQGTEGGLAARAVIVTLENTSLFEDQGDFQVGRSMRAIVGTIESIGEGRITVSTKIGPRTATIIAGETAFQLPTAASMDELSPGQLVTVIGREDADGSIAAQSVLITPDLGDLMAAGRRGGGRGGAQSQAPASEGGSAATPAPAVILPSLMLSMFPLCMSIPEMGSQRKLYFVRFLHQSSEKGSIMGHASAWEILLYS